MAISFPPFPKFPTDPGAPSIGPRTFGPALQPLKGPEIEIPGDQQKDLQARWEVWRNRRTGSGTGSILEFICWEWLTQRKKQREEIDFIYQYPLAGGRTQLGGFVADFFFPKQRMVWNPAGLQFHQTKPRDRARDQLARIVLANRGIKLVYLYEDDLLNRPEYTLKKAWNGEEIPRPQH